MLIIAMVSFNLLKDNFAKLVSLLMIMIGLHTIHLQKLILYIHE
jgi:hypothetical protein